MLKQARPLVAPASEEMPMRALTRFVAVRTTERFVLQNLRTNRKCKCIKSAPRQKEKAQLSAVRAKPFSWRLLMDTTFPWFSNALLKVALLGMNVVSVAL